MAYQHISPSNFVDVGEKVHAVFVDGDVAKWYEGEVKLVTTRSEDKDGKFVECDVLFNDGETLETVLHDADFCNKDSLDSWRFSWSTSRLIQEVEHIHSKTHMDPVHTKTNRFSIVCLASSFLAAFAILGIMAYCRYDPEEPRVCPLVTPWEAVMLSSIRTLRERLVDALPTMKASL